MDAPSVVVVLTGTIQNLLPFHLSILQSLARSIESVFWSVQPADQETEFVP